MRLTLSPGLIVLASAAWLTASAGALAQAPATDYKPQVGQAGKDVVWVPTPQALVDKMLDMAKATPSDYVVDLGSGDGRTVITAAKRGIKAHGIEYNPDMAELAKRNAAKEGVSDKATFANADIFKSEFSNATVVTLFLLPSLNLKLRPTLLAMKPGTRVVSNSFTMDDWQADDTAQVTEGCTSFCKAYLWIVPAKVEGTWTLGQSELKLEQTFQMLKGTLTTGNVVAPLTGKMNGAEITFTAANVTYEGRVSDTSMSGTSKGGGQGEAKWTAARK
jgi:SAM-dependent methyltransferase